MGQSVEHEHVISKALFHLLFTSGHVKEPFTHYSPQVADEFINKRSQKLALLSH